MLEGETAKLLRMEEVIGERLIGQRAAVTAVSDAVRRSRAGHQRPQPSRRLVPLPRPDRHRQDRAGEGARRLPLRRRAGDRPHRHERVLREARGGPAGRCPSRLRRLRRGWPAHRGGAPAPLLRGAARRGREGAPRGLRHPAAGARRRSAHRRPGPHGRLPQHPADPDQQPGLVLPRRPHPRRGQEARVRAGDGAVVVQARVPQPARRDRALRRADPRRAHPHRRPAARAAREATGRAPDLDRGHRRPRRPGSPRPATTRRTAPDRCAG